MTIDEFIIKALSVPFKAKGRSYQAWDCYGLVYRAYKDVFNIDLPSFKDQSYKSAYLELKQIINNEKQNFEEVNNPMLGDIALYSCKSNHPHVALVINKREALHCEGKSGTYIDQINNVIWKNRLDGFFRIKK